MNFMFSKKLVSQLLVLTGMVVILIIATFSFQWLYQGFQVFEPALRVSAREAGHYLSAIANTR